MKVSSINSLSISDKKERLSLSRINNRKCESGQYASQRVYASHLGFKGGIPLNNLINDYRWFVNNDKVLPVNAFLKIEAPKDSMNQLLQLILSKEDLSYEFIDSIVKQPRNINNFYKSFNDKLPWNADVFNLYSPNNLYMKAYENYLDRKYENASSVSELLTIRPDWKEEILLNKHKELFHNDNFELGSVPESIGKENFSKITEYLSRYAGFGFKTNCEIPDLNINGKVFKFKQYIDGKSDKRVFKIETPEGERYVIKIQDPSRNGLNIASGLGTVSLVDTFLTKNNCRNTAPIRYYNRNSNTALYDYINHHEVPQIRFSIQELSEKMPDTRELGITINDTVGTNNYFRLDNTQNSLKSAYDFNYGVNHGEVVSVDNDHAAYSKMLQPMVNKYLAYLPNEMQMFF